MSTPEKKVPDNHFMRYLSVFLTQFMTNREYFYFWTDSPVELGASSGDQFTDGYFGDWSSR
jgi:hypothetical protein